MPRVKRDPNLATVTYNVQNVERAIGYVAALINKETEYQDALIQAVDNYDLSLIENAMVQIGTVELVAPQFRQAKLTVPTEIVDIVAVDLVFPTSKAIAQYTLEQIEVHKLETNAAQSVEAKNEVKLTPAMAAAQERIAAKKAVKTDA